MIETTVTCDECGQKKGSGNHWFRVFVHNSDGTHFISIGDWDMKQMETETHACSDACVVMVMQKWLSAQKSHPSTRTEQAA